MTLHIKDSGAWSDVTGIYIKDSGAWQTVTEGYIKVSGAWAQFWPTSAPYTFYFGNTIYVGTNGYISFDSGQTVISIASTIDRVFGILPADLVMNSVHWAADGSKFYLFWRGKRFSGGTNFEIQYEVHLTSGQDYALLKFVSFPSSTYSTTAYYVDGSRTGYSFLSSRTVGGEYRLYFGTTASFSTAFSDFGTSTSPVWLSQSSADVGTTDDGYVVIIANQGSGPSAPTSVTASSITTSSATVSWSAPTNLGMSAIQQYDYSTNGGSSWTPSSGNSVNLTGLSQGTNYTVLVRAINYFFTGTSYGSVNFTTQSNLTAPTITSISSGSAGSSLSVYFTGGSGPFYQLYWTTSNTAPTSPVTPDASGSSSPLTDSVGPSVGGTYYAYVRSVATTGETSVGPSTVASVWSAGVSFTIPIVPTIPTLVASSITSSSATLTWTSTDQATYSITGLPSPYSGTTATSRGVTGLSASTSYTATVTVASSTGNTASRSVTFTTLASTPPAPTGFSFVRVPASDTATTKGYSASWSAVSGANLYQVSREGINGNTSTATYATTSTGTFNLSTATSSTYRARVRASYDSGSTYGPYSSYSPASGYI